MLPPTIPAYMVTSSILYKCPECKGHWDESLSRSKYSNTLSHKACGARLRTQGNAVSPAARRLTCFRLNDRPRCVIIKCPKSLYCHQISEILQSDTIRSAASTEITSVSPVEASRRRNMTRNGSARATLWHIHNRPELLRHSVPPHHILPIHPTPITSRQTSPSPFAILPPRTLQHNPPPIGILKRPPLHLPIRIETAHSPHAPPLQALHPRHRSPPRLVIR